MGGPGAEGGYGVTFLSFISLLGTDCQSAKCLEGAFPVQYFILMGSSGVKEVSGEEQWENPEGTFIPGEKQCLGDTSAKRAEGGWERSAGKRGQGCRKMEQEIERRQTRSDVWSGRKVECWRVENIFIRHKDKERRERK